MAALPGRGGLFLTCGKDIGNLGLLISKIKIQKFEKIVSRKDAKK
jgi:hypothetical protein